MPENIIDKLTNAFSALPGVGQKSAQRIALYILQNNRPMGTMLASELSEVLSSIQNCQHCYHLCETAVCDICANPDRNAHSLCVVESSADLMAIEGSAAYQGRYFVLNGSLSPMDGIGPKQLHFDALESKLSQGEVNEVIIATNPNVEGEVTAHALAGMAKRAGVNCTRIAQGVPTGSELDYVDRSTLSQAFKGRWVM